MAKSIEQIRDEAFVQVSKSLYTETLFRQQVQEIYRMYINLIGEQYEFATLPEEEEMQQLINDLMDEEIVYGYTLYSNTKEVAPEILTAFDTYNAESIRITIPSMIEQILDGPVGKEGLVPSVEEMNKRLVQHYEINQQYIYELIAASVSYGFYQGLVDHWKENNRPIHSTFKDTIIGSKTEDPYALTPLHFIIHNQTNSSYEWFDLYGWGTLGIEGKVGEILYLKEGNVLAVQLHHLIPSTHREYIVDRLTQSISTIEPLHIRLTISQGFFETELGYKEMQ